MHSVLKRQLKRSFKEGHEIAPEWRPFLNLVSDTYAEFDKDRVRMEQSLEISSKELQEYNSLLKATLDSTRDGVLVVDDKGKMIEHNRAFLDIWNIPEEVMNTHDDDKALEYVLDQLKEPEEFLKKVRELYANIESDSRDTLYFKDGRIIDRYSIPQRVDGRSVGRVWNFRDVTEVKEAELELKKQIEELEKLNNLMVERELKMVELKEEIKRLKRN